MKKLIAVLLCSIHFSTFTWNWDFLKPNFSSWYQSWTNLPPNQQNILIGASTGATLALLYAGWPVSQASARAKAMLDYDNRKQRTEDFFKGKTEKLDDFDTVKQITDQFELTRFPYGSFFNRNRPEYRVFTNNLTLQEGSTFSKRFQGQATNYVQVGVINSANTTSKEEFYLPNIKSWKKIKDDLD